MIGVKQKVLEGGTATSNAAFEVLCHLINLPKFVLTGNRHSYAAHRHAAINRLKERP